MKIKLLGPEGLKQIPYRFYPTSWHNRLHSSNVQQTPGELLCRSNEWSNGVLGPTSSPLEATDYHNNNKMDVMALPQHMGGYIISMCGMAYSHFSTL